MLFRIGTHEIIIPDIAHATAEGERKPVTTSINLRRSIDNAFSNSMMCFICNIKRECDGNHLGEGGIGRCSDDRVARRIKDRMPVYLRDVDHRFFEAAKRIELMFSTVHDIFAAERKSVEEVENTEELEIEMVTQGEVDWNKAFFRKAVMKKVRLTVMILMGEIG